MVERRSVPLQASRAGLPRSRAAPAFVGALMGAALTGCIDLAPRFQTPPAPIPAAFPSGSAYLSPRSGPSEPSGWRDFFKDPKLRAVIEAALSANRDLRVAAANVEAAGASFQAQRAALLPTVALQATASYLQEPASVAGGGPASGAYNQKLYSLEAAVPAYELDFFSRVTNLTRAAKDQYLASRAARDTVQITLIADVAAAYLTLQSDGELLRTARDTLTAGEANVEVTRRRLQAGVDSELDAAQAETIVQQARFDLARYATKEAQDLNALTLLVGAPIDPALLPSGPITSASTLSALPSTLSSAVLLARPDVVQAEDSLRAANADIGAARAAFFPSISLTGAGGVESLALSHLFTGPAGAWSFAPSVAQTLFDGGLNRANLAYAAAQKKAAVASYEKAVQTAFREAADALALHGTVDDQVRAQQGLLGAAAASLRLSTLRYKSGSDAYVAVLIAQRTVYAAEQSLIQAELSREVNGVTLYAALGGGLHPGA